ncbi:unnamed protein product [Phytomonas sp. Hart1]|nr:unnamed protein product [Phytomonas sp. Hart1]|eukprot:CCW66750.1 unnamed protein product [Phytomonas sp. isolate Hart1]
MSSSSSNYNLFNHLMSVWSYERDHQQVLSDLIDLQNEDAYVSSLSLPEEAKLCNEHVKRNWLSLYVRYLSVAKRLEARNNTELQAQKISDVRTLLNCSLGRLLEIKEVIVKHCGNFLPIDDTLLDLKMTPDEVEPPICSYFLEDREEELRERRSFIASLQAHFMETDNDAPVSEAQRHPQALVDPSKAVAAFVSGKLQVEKDRPSVSASTTVSSTDVKPPFTLDEAVLILQTCERGRQARRRATFQLALHHRERHLAQHGNEFNTITGKDRAAAVVQRIVLGYLERKQAKQRYEAEREFLGLVPTEEIRSNREAAMAAVHVQENKLRQRMNIVELRQKAQNIEHNIKYKEGPKTIEEMLDEILMHMAYLSMESKGDPSEAATALLEFPSPQEGGSLKLLERMPTTSKDPAAGVGGRRGQAAARRPPSSAPAADTAPPRPSLVNNGRSASRVGSVGRESRNGSTVLMKPQLKGSEGDTQSGEMMGSCFWKQIKETEERYQNVWLPHYHRHCLEEGDLNRQVDEVMLKQELLEGPHGILSELRNCVDELVMIEVQNLQEKMKSEKNSKKKGKKTAKTKKMKLKDPTKGVNLETAINTVVYENKWQLVPVEVRLRSFVGSDNLMSNPYGQMLRQQRPDEEITKKWQRILRNWNESVEKAMGGIKKEAFEKLFQAYIDQSTWLKEPSSAQIRRAVAEYGILPLGSQIRHDLVPHKDALLFYGVSASGKTMMAYAMCNEAGANFFNLSPSNFSSVKGIPKIIQLVFYVARMKGPSIIYIDNIEKVFPSKKNGKKKRTH